MHLRAVKLCVLAALAGSVVYILGPITHNRVVVVATTQVSGQTVNLSLPSKKQVALIVHDMVNDGLKPGGRMVEQTGIAPGTQEVIANNVRLLQAARRHRLAVFHTGHFLRDDGFDAAYRTRAGKMGALRAGTWGGDFIDELKPSPGETIIRKGGGYSAFTGTALEKWLRRRGIVTILIGGVSTNSGVESTVRAAVDLDFNSVVVSDACNARPANHQASLLNMAQFAEIATTAEVIAALDKAPN